MKSTLRLFKALPIGVHDKVGGNDDFCRHTLQSGFIFTPEVLANYPSSDLMKMVDDLYGRNSTQLNQTFHKSWDKVRHASHESLVLEQMLHYMTTYGFEQLGVYSNDTVWIPAEELNVPELEDGIRLVVIRGLTKAELKTKLFELLSSGVALHEDTVADVLDVAAYVRVDEADLVNVKNREVKAALYDYLGMVPSDPAEFLRFMVYRITGQTLLIKNDQVINEIKGGASFPLVRYFDAYEKDQGLAPLASIFYRYKPIFLAMRTNTVMRQKINQIRRLAKHYHKPMKADLLNEVTAKISRGELYPSELARALESANTFRKIRLAYALKFRTTDADSILYQVRNGRSWATYFHYDNKDGAHRAFYQVMDSIVDDVADNVRGKKIFIPTGVRYALPATEKQFTGNIPNGTCVETKGGMVAGIHWEDQDNHRIDLDLSLQSIDGKIGWDSYYRNDRGNVLFSGDLTSAPLPKGATELFALSGNDPGTWLMSVNYFNFDANVPVPFKIVVGNDSPRTLSQSYTINPNHLVAQSTSTLDEHQKVLGIIIRDEHGQRFYFSESNMGSGRTSRRTKHGEQARDFLFNRFTDTISLNEVLTDAGAILVDDPALADIDLSIEAIDKTSILKLVTK